MSDIDVVDRAILDARTEIEAERGDYSYAEIARQTGIKYSSVYNRVSRMSIRGLWPYHHPGRESAVPPPKADPSALLGKVREYLKAVGMAYEVLIATEAFLIDELGGPSAVGGPSIAASSIRSALDRMRVPATPEQIVAAIARGHVEVADEPFSAPEAFFIQVLHDLRTDPRFTYAGEGRWALAEWRRQLPSPDIAEEIIPTEAVLGRTEGEKVRRR